MLLSILKAFYIIRFIFGANLNYVLQSNFTFKQNYLLYELLCEHKDFFSNPNFAAIRRYGTGAFKKIKCP